MIDVAVTTYAVFLAQSKGQGVRVYYTPKRLTDDGGLASPFAAVASLGNGDTLRWFATPGAPDQPATFAADFPAAVLVNSGLV